MKDYNESNKNLPNKELVYEDWHSDKNLYRVK